MTIHLDIASMAAGAVLLMLAEVALLVVAAGWVAARKQVAK